jgi:hypothetical protein
MGKIEEMPRWYETGWYERAQWRYAKDQRIVAGYADWLVKVPWQLFCTFTFAWKAWIIKPTKHLSNS